MTRDTTTGKKYENQTMLPPVLVKAGYTVNKHVYTSPCGTFEVTFHNYTSIHKKKVGLLEVREAPNRNKMSMKKRPDEGVLIKNLVDGSERFIVVEKKTQKTSGSADEKLETIHFKKDYFKKLFAGINIEVEYVYLLSAWFKHSKYDDVREYFDKYGYKAMYETYDLKVLGL